MITFTSSHDIVTFDTKQFKSIKYFSKIASLLLLKLEIRIPHCLGAKHCALLTLTKELYCDLDTWYKSNMVLCYFMGTFCFVTIML